MLFRSKVACVRALVLVVLKSYIAIFSTFLAPPNTNLWLHSQSQIIWLHSAELIGKKKVSLNYVFTLLYIKYIILFVCSQCSEYIILL